MTATSATEKISYEQFRSEWLSEIEEGNPSPLEKGRRFATKLITQWLGVTTDDDDFVVCDGAGDGGIDIAYLRQADVDPGSREENAEEGHTWYLFQSKYGTAFAGTDTILAEGNKVITTLQGQNRNLSEDSRQLIKKIDLFRQQLSKSDRIVLVFATTDPIALRDRQALDAIQTIGRERVMLNFDVEEVSLQSIWGEQTHLSVSIIGQFVEQSSGWLVGTVSLSDLFQFLKSYQRQTGNLDKLYDKNVRQFLGGRKKINKGIADTLTNSPEKFGLYNNGITIVVSEYRKQPDDRTIMITNPYIVNGCQTTKTIWQVLDSRFNAGGTGVDSANDSWKEMVARGGLVTKIVRSDEAETTDITKFTNSQNAIRQKDFAALDTEFRNWATAMEEEYKVFLEIQRGGTESRKAYEKQHPDQPKFSGYVNAFDLIKIYGAGWLAKPGLAFGKNAPFLPGGSVYESIVSQKDRDKPFGVRDLYAAYQLKIVADKNRFGRTAEHPSRRLSRFLFYYIIMRMLRNVILSPQLSRPAVSASDLTDAVVKLAGPDTKEQLDLLTNAATKLLDGYLTLGSQFSVYDEDPFKAKHNGNLNALLKADHLGSEDYTPILTNAFHAHNAALDITGGREKIAAALNER